MNREWLEADGLGGFASGPVEGPRTRRYHALLLAAKPGLDRVVLVNGCDVFLETAAGRFALAAQHYTPDVVAASAATVESFSHEPWPTWTLLLPDGTRIRHELFVPREEAAVVLSWQRLAGSGAARLLVRPFLSGRGYHALQRENAVFRFEAEVAPGRVSWQPYASQPAVHATGNSVYREDPHWYRNFVYAEERARGLDHLEDLAAPGELAFDLAAGEATLALSTAPLTLDTAEAWRVAERQRRAKSGGLQRAADAYLVRRGQGLTIVAGYPWFTDWGRDTFIALRGLALATGRLDAARHILLQWSEAVSQGMLPNRFPDGGEPPEYNSVDASLWFVVAVHEYLRAAGASAADDRARLQATVDAIVSGYAAGTRHGIRLDDDGLLAAGEPGVQLTWMDARVGDHVITPRIGKPVEVQALWLNALWISGAWTARWEAALARGLDSFRERFWNEARGSLFDVVDDGHQPGARDERIRPNQVLAVGGLPLALLQGERARRLVQTVEEHLLTPLGLRSLAPSEPGYVGRYQGGVAERDGAYHQGPVWPWLLGPFAEAWVRVRGSSLDAKAEARRRFLEPLLAHLGEAGVGHVSEIADGDAPHTPRGCPFQAWSLGELIRLDREVLAQPAAVDAPSALHGPAAVAAEA